MFGISKVIFGESGINEVIVDIEGDYGMTQGAIGLKIGSKKEGLIIKDILESGLFDRILKALSFGNFRIDWRIFSYFKKDFYKFISKKRENLTKMQKLTKNKYQKIKNYEPI
jgi:hypothetical protein